MPRVQGRELQPERGGYGARRRPGQRQILYSHENVQVGEIAPGKPKERTAFQQGARAICI